MTAKIFVTMLLTGVAAWAQGQSVVRCPPTAMTGGQIETQIKAQVPETRITEFIKSCHVGFGMRSAAFTHLKDSGASSAIVGAVRRDIYQRMSLKDAQDELKALGDDLRKTTSEIESRRDKELSALEGPYSQKREALAQVPPQTKFQKDADYQALLRKSQDDVATLDRAHELEKSRVTVRYAEEIRRAASENEALVSTIKRQNYPVEGAALTFDDYDANNERLIAKVGGDTYWFSVPPEKAKDLYSRAAKAKVTRGLDEDALKTRALVDTVTDSTYSGYSKAAKEAVDAAAKAEADRKAREAAAKLVAAQGEMEEGIAAAKKEDFAGARRHLDTSCTGGIMDACAELAVLLSNETVGTVDFVRARQLSVRACDGGVLNACGHLGVLYEDGEGGPVDLPKAEASYRKACDGNLQQACIQLGSLYEKGGPGVKPNPARAGVLYLTACKSIVDACVSVGRMYRDGRGFPKNPAAAVPYFRKACDANNGAGCHELGISTKDGAGVPKDSVLATTLFEKACSLKEYAGCEFAGFRYISGDGVRKNIPNGLAFLKRACDADYLQGCVQLGEYYWAGKEVKRDYAAALVLFDSACGKGDQEGCSYLGLMYDLGQAVRKDEMRAAGLYEKACGKDEPLGCALLGIIQRQGYGSVPPNPVQGRATLQKACKLGNQSACQELK